MIDFFMIMVGGILGVFLVIGFIILMPVVFLWALNTLGLSVPYTLMTWLASAAVIFLLSG